MTRKKKQQSKKGKWSVGKTGVVSGPEINNIREARKRRWIKRLKDIQRDIDKSNTPVPKKAVRRRPKTTPDSVEVTP